MMAGRGTCQLREEAAGPDLGGDRYAMLAGIRLGGLQPSVARAQPVFVLFPDLAHASAVPARGMLFHGDRDQPGTFHLSEADCLS
jgi:hypothetical protein